MLTFLSTIRDQFLAIDWNGPVWIAVAILVILLIMRKWSILLLTLLTIVLAWGAEDMMISNIETNRPIVSLSFLIYSVGGVLIIILTIIAFFQSD